VWCGAVRGCGAADAILLSVHPGHARPHVGARSPCRSHKGALTTMVASPAYEAASGVLQDRVHVQPACTVRVLCSLSSDLASDLACVGCVASDVASDALP